MMNDNAISILDENRIMAISTVRADGRPHTTYVGYANEGLTLYFVIFRGSEKFANISSEKRVAVAIGKEPPEIRLARAFYAGATVSEVIDPALRDHAWRLLVQRHLNLVGSPQPDWSKAAMMRAECQHGEILDYTMGLGHTDALYVAAEGIGHEREGDQHPR